MNYDKWEDQNISFDEWKEIIHNNSDSYMKFYNDESVRIKALDDKNSRKQLSKLIEIMGEMGELQFMEELRNRREVSKRVQQIGVTFCKNPYSKEELIKKWEENFLQTLTERDKEECFLDYYLWHVFTYKKLKWNCCGYDAQIEFDRKEKHDLLVFWQNSDDTYLLKNCEKLDFRCFRFELSSDCYITDSNFEWTCIMPHDAESPIWYEPSCK